MFIKRQETEPGYLDNPWRYCFKSTDVGGELWCSLEGINLIYPVIEEWNLILIKDILNLNYSKKSYQNQRKKWYPIQ